MCAYRPGVRCDKGAGRGVLYVIWCRVVGETAYWLHIRADIQATAVAWYKSGRMTKEEDSVRSREKRGESWPVYT